MSLPRAIERLTRPLKRRIMLMIGRAVVLAVQDDSGLQRVKLGVLSDEIRDGVERFGQYGFYSHPLPGADALILSLGGNRDHPVAVAVDDRRHRPRNALAGESGLYAALGGARIRVMMDGSVEIIAPANLRIVAPLVRIEGDLHVTGDITDLVDSDPHTIRAFRDIYNAHTHFENDNGGPTATPVGQV